MRTAALQNNHDEPLPDGVKHVSQVMNEVLSRYRLMKVRCEPTRALPVTVVTPAEQLVPVAVS